MVKLERLYISLLSNGSHQGVLRTSDTIQPSGSTVLDLLKQKHPSGQPLNEDALMDCVEDSLANHPIIYDSIDSICNRRAALSTFGAGGPSFTDAHFWRRLCTLFKEASASLCHSLSLVAKRMSTTYVNPEGLSALLSCRLIALDKNPGVRPIGICEVVRRIIAKAVLSVVRADIIDAAGSLQLSAGQIAGVEAAVHAIRGSFDEQETEGLLLVDAENAFNLLNRQTALCNIRHLCPSLLTILINCYRCAADLFVDGQTSQSSEGTTQGDALAMPMYSLAVLPLISRLRDIDEIRQVWYADDASAVGSLDQLRHWWDALKTTGPGFGYHPKSCKSWLVVKDQHLEEAERVFGDLGINITTEGRSYLGVPIGSPTFVDTFVRRKVDEWNEMLHTLSDFAISQPHAAHSVLMHGLSSKWIYLCQTTSDVSPLLEPLHFKNYFVTLTNHLSI